MTKAKSSSVIFPDILREAHHHQHIDQVNSGSVFLKYTVQCLDIPRARLSLSPRNITCIGHMAKKVLRTHRSEMLFLFERKNTHLGK